MKYMRNQSGFAHLVVVAILLALIGIAGLVAYRSLGATNRNSSANKVGSPPKPSASAAPTYSPSPSPVSTTKYLVLTQWGLKLPAAGLLANLQYEIVDGSVRLYTSELYPKYSMCGPHNEGLGSLGRIPAATDRPDQQGIKAGTFGGYNYYFWEAQQPCVQGVPVESPDAQLDQNQQNALLNEMRQLTLEPAR